MKAEELREARKGLNLTQRQMAEALQTPFRTYQDWEAGIPKIPGVVAVAVECLMAKEGKKKKC